LNLCRISAPVAPGERHQGDKTPHWCAGPKRANCRLITRHASAASARTQPRSGSTSKPGVRIASLKRASRDPRFMVHPDFFRACEWAALPPTRRLGSRFCRVDSWGRTNSRSTLDWFTPGSVVRPLRGKRTHASGFIDRSISITGGRFRRVKTHVWVSGQTLL